MKLLLEHNADPNLALEVKTVPGTTPAMPGYVAGTGSNMIMTPTRMAALNGHIDLVKLLLSHRPTSSQAIHDDYRELAKSAEQNKQADIAALLMDTRKCDTCSEPGTRSVCKGCTKGRYCSHACQKGHWREHKGACQAQQLKYHNKYCESTTLFGPGGWCSGCGEGLRCYYSGCSEAGCRRHAKCCKVGKKTAD